MPLLFYSCQSNKRGVLVVDVTESPIERPKKNSERNDQWEEKAAHFESTSDG